MYSESLYCSVAWVSIHLELRVLRLENRTDGPFFQDWFVQLIPSSVSSVKTNYPCPGNHGSVVGAQRSLESTNQL